MTYPVFTNGTVLPASDLNAIGLWLVKSQTVGTGVSSVSVSDAFSSTYDNYRITYSSDSGLASINFALNGSTNGHYSVLQYEGYAAAGSVVRTSNGTSWAFVGGGITIANMCMEIQNPYLTKPTFFSAAYADSGNTGMCTGMQSQLVSFTGFTLSFAGPMTGGTISVYGYRKA